MCGARGLEDIKKNKGFVIAQDKETSLVYGMPDAAVKRGVVDIELSLNNIAPTILKILK